MEQEGGVMEKPANVLTEEMLQEAVYPEAADSAVIVELTSKYLTDIGILSNYKQIEALYLWHNLIYDISPIAELHNIRRLYLGAAFSRDDPNLDFLVYFPHLQVLELSSCGIMRVFSIAKYAPGVVTLVLDCNKIASFPALEEIRMMPNLFELSLKFNPIYFNARYRQTVKNLNQRIEILDGEDCEVS